MTGETCGVALIVPSSAILHRTAEGGVLIIIPVVRREMHSV